MNWLIIAILSYFFLAVVSLFDRYFLVGPVPNPKIYTFYIGILWFFISVFFIPFGISLPKTDIIFLGLLTGLIRILAILFLTKSIIESEVSRAIPAIGGLLPIFTFLLFFLSLPKSEIFDLSQIVALISLLIGSVLISLRKSKDKFLNFRTLKYPVVTAFLFALAFFLTKNLYLETSFLNGFFLVLLGGGLGTISFLIFPQNRKEIFSQRPTQKISGLFLLGQAAGGVGVFAQFYAIFLAKPSQVPIINALDGVRYVFLLFFVFILSTWKPELLKEEMKGATLFQKLVAILFIGMGLAILAFKK